PDDMQTLSTQYRVGRYLLGTQKYSEAVALLQDATIRLRRIAGPAHPETQAAGYLLVEAHMACNRPEPAAALADDMAAAAAAAGETDAATGFRKLAEQARAAVATPPLSRRASSTFPQGVGSGGQE